MPADRHTMNALSLVLIAAGGDYRYARTEPPKMTSSNGTKAPPTVIKPDPDSRLAALLAQYDQAYDAEEQATKALKEVKDAIKVEANRVAPNAERITIDSPYTRKPLGQKWAKRSGLDGARIERDHPEIYAEYRVDQSRWELGYVR